LVITKSREAKPVPGLPGGATDENPACLGRATSPPSAWRAVRSVPTHRLPISFCPTVMHSTSKTFSFPF
jgi:hypothetical protein